MTTPQHRPLPPSAQAAGITAAQYADALLSGREWCSRHGGYVAVGLMYDGARLCKACQSAARKEVDKRRRGARRRDK